MGYMEEPYYGWHSAGFLCFTRKDTSPVSDCLYTSFFKLKKGRDIYEFTDAYLNDYSVTYNSELLRTQGISANRCVYASALRHVRDPDSSDYDGRRIPGV